MGVVISIHYFCMVKNTTQNSVLNAYFSIESSGLENWSSIAFCLYVYSVLEAWL